MSPLPRIRSTKSIAFREIVLLAIDSFRLNQIRFALTALGMVIGTASLILVVTIGLSGRQYVLTSIQNIGTNLDLGGVRGAIGCQRRVGTRLPDGRRYARGRATGSRAFRPHLRYSTCTSSSHRREGRNAMS